MGVTTPPFERRQKTMSEKIVQLNEEIIKSELKELVRSSVEETLNGMLE
jgi:putative transposase